jgi:hypothetical protein
VNLNVETGYISSGDFFVDHLNAFCNNYFSILLRPTQADSSAQLLITVRCLVAQLCRLTFMTYLPTTGQTSRFWGKLNHKRNLLAVRTPKAYPWPKPRCLRQKLENRRRIWVAVELKKKKTNTKTCNFTKLARWAS